MFTAIFGFYQSEVYFLVKIRPFTRFIVLIMLNIQLPSYSPFEWAFSNHIFHLKKKNVEKNDYSFPIAFL